MKILMFLAAFGLGAIAVLIVLLAAGAPAQLLGGELFVAACVLGSGAAVIEAVEQAGRTIAAAKGSEQHH